VREAEEPFSAGQKGSSAMPHKRNPVTCEQICGLARVVRANAQAAFENIALWHERDISHSSVERVILPDSTFSPYLLEKTAWLVKDMRVYRTHAPQRMWPAAFRAGAARPTGAGMLRERACRLVQAHAMRPGRDAIQAIENMTRRSRLPLTRSDRGQLLARPAEPATSTDL
jgi:adenylosuccinate lyase